MERPIVAIAVGDPAGIGPEVTVRALAVERLYDLARPFAICDLRIVREAIARCGLALEVRALESPAAGLYRAGCVDVLDLPNVDLGAHRMGRVQPAAGKASVEYVRAAIDLALAGTAHATVTGPVSKEAMHLAGHRYAGQTELYADLTATTDYAMMLADGAFRVTHVSTHCSLREAVDRVRKDRILRTIRLTHAALMGLGIRSPQIAVAGLNPHAGEGGLFGREEIEEIAPAVGAARADGISVDGPLPPDTVYVKHAGGMYDAVVAMYHDQGHIPAKLRGFRYDARTDTWGAVSGVNVTLGLPIVRVSVDHGTAFDRAEARDANPQSMIQAIELAAVLARNVRAPAR